MKSYAESKESEIINWGVELTGKKIDWDSLKIKAESWETCSIGQLSELINRIKGEPIDSELENIGVNFNNSIRNEDVEIALIWLKRGNSREIFLLSELRADFLQKSKSIKEYLNGKL